MPIKSSQTVWWVFSFPSKENKKQHSKTKTVKVIFQYMVYSRASDTDRYF